MTIPLIRLKGEPFSRGLSYGIAAKEQILKTIEEYKVLFDKEAHISWDDAMAAADKLHNPIQAVCPDLVEEMKGIASGAGLDYSAILTLNCRSEIMFSSFEDSCTAIGIPPEVSGTGKTYIAQNWDFWSIGKGTSVVLEIEQPPLPKVLIVTEAGIIGGKGLNDKGIGLTMNAMSVKKGKIGIPVQCILRRALSQTTLPKAIDSIATVDRAGSACVGLASSDGLVVMVEFAPNNMDVLLSNGEPLCHTNHWISPVMIADPETSRYSFKSTYTRLDMARRLAKAEIGNFRKRVLFKILSNHVGNPDGICRHDDMDLPEYHRHSSLWSMVIDTCEKTIWLTDGSPCKTKPTGYKIFD